MDYLLLQFLYTELTQFTQAFDRIPKIIQIMNFRKTLTIWTAIPLASMACLSNTHAENQHVEIETAETDPLIKRFQEDLRLIEKMRSIYEAQGDREAVASLTKEIHKVKDTFFRMSELSKIEISSSTNTSVHPLTKNTARLSGGYRPTFSHVGEAIDGAEFTRVPWKSKPTFQINAITSGYIYMIGVGTSNFDKTDAEIIEVDDMLAGKYVGTCYRVYLRKGQSYECSGYETCLIGRTISIQVD